MATTELLSVGSLAVGDTVEFELVDEDGFLLGVVDRTVCVGGECRAGLVQSCPEQRWCLIESPGGQQSARVRTITTEGELIDFEWVDRGAVESVEVVVRGE